MINGGKRRKHETATYTSHDVQGNNTRKLRENKEITRNLPKRKRREKKMKRQGERENKV